MTAREDIDAFWDEVNVEYVVIDDDISQLRTQRLRSLAEKYLLPYPNCNDEGMWLTGITGVIGTIIGLIAVWGTK